MKIIFLDIDGVLNVVSQGHDEYGSLFHPHLVDNLKYIIDLTGAKIVIISTWRYSGLTRMQEMWKVRNLPGEVVGITPDLSTKQKSGLWLNVIRGKEIEKYIEQNPCDKYVIIDDDVDMTKEQMSFFVQTSNNSTHSDCVDIGYGLTRQCAEKAINILLG
jgi:hypothetical protein